MENLFKFSNEAHLRHRIIQRFMRFKCSYCLHHNDEHDNGHTFKILAVSTVDTLYSTSNKKCVKLAVNEA